jgi:hypothetical protein
VLKIKDINALVSLVKLLDALRSVGMELLLVMKNATMEKTLDAEITIVRNLMTDTLVPVEV